MKKQGQALIIVVAFLAMFFVIGVAFFLLAQTEQLSAIKHLDAIRSRYIAEAGISYAKAVLTFDKDANAIDSLQDLSFAHFKGEGYHWDREGVADSVWFTITDSDEVAFGRFTVAVADEAGKLNVNVCTQDDLQRLCALTGVDTALAETIIAKRPFDAIEEAGQVMGDEEFDKVRDYLTVYSRDWEFDLNKKRRVYLNAANPQLVLDVFLKRGIDDARRKAGMLIDAADTDPAATVFSEATLNYVTPTGMLDQGGWVNKGSFYESLPGSATGVFLWTNLALVDGDYDCFLYAPGEEDVVGVIGNQYVRSGDKLTYKIAVLNGGFTLSIDPVGDAVCKFSHVELINDELLQGMKHAAVRGAEAVVINEMMVNPVREYSVGLSAGPGDTVKKTVTVSDLLPGLYHARVVSSGYAGNVRIGNAAGNNLDNGDYLPQAVEVGTALSLTVTLTNSDSVKTAHVGAVKLTQQPDGEYIEILNLSPYSIDISGYIVEAFDPDGELIAGWPAMIPAGTVIEPFQYLVLNVDSNDGSQAPDKLKGNRISFKSIWGFSGINLYFEDYHSVIDNNFDLLPDTAATVYLKDAFGRVVDAVEYAEVQLNPFTSIERGDPSARIDDDEDALIDGWYASNTNKQGTPGLTNENLGMYTEQEGVLTKHLTTELRVFNRPLADLLEVSQIPSGSEWTLFDMNDIVRLADSFAYDAQLLDVADTQSGDGVVTLGANGGSANWEFEGIAYGVYWVSLTGVDVADLPVRIAVSVTEGETLNYVTRSFEGNNLPFGTVELRGTQAEGGALRVGVINENDREVTISRVVLEPLISVSGRVNVNTASEFVLRSIIPSNHLVNALVGSRPFGNANGQKFGIGDLIAVNSDFLTYHKSLSVKSDTYELQSRGEFLKNDVPSTSDLIRIIFERGD